MRVAKGFAVSVVLLGIALLFKFVLLDRVPGINGDEAIGAVWMRDFSNGTMAWPWWTPTNRPLSPLVMAMMYVVAKTLPPDFGYMRLVPALCHVALLLAAWQTMKNRLDARQRILFLLLLSALPLHTTFARIAWDPCLIPLLSYLTVFFAIDRRFIWSNLALCIAVLTHSTCIFLAPLVYVVWASDLVSTKARRPAWAKFSLLGLAMGGLSLYVLALAGGETKSQATVGIWSRLGNPGELLEFFGLLFYTFIGTTSFGEFVGTPMEANWLPPVKVIGMASMLGVLMLWRVFFVRGKRDACVLLAGWLVSLLLFYGLAGNSPLTIGYQRYILWAAVPFVFVTHDALTLLRFRDAAIIGVSGLFLVGTAYGYFYKSMTRSIAAYPAVYASGMPEPKKAAYEWIRSASQQSLPTNHHRAKVLAENWWLYWPGRYWLYDSPIDFYHAEQPISTGLPLDQQVLSTQGILDVLAARGFVVAFANGPLAQRLTQVNKSIGCDVKTFNDAGGAALIQIWHCRH